MKNLLQIFTVALVVLTVACDQPKTETNGTSNNDTDTVTAVSSTYSMSSMSSVACDDSKRYLEEGEPGGGVGLSKDDALKAIDAYREKNPGSVTGFHLSKKALDSLFSVYADANGIWVDLVNPRDIPKYSSTDSIGVIISVKNNPHYELRFHSGNAAYISENECPTMCARF